MIEISVIIPVYNAEKYIRNIMERIKQQTFSNYEVIFINDGSIDNSQEICDEIAEKEKNIKVVKQENQGPSVARNSGIANAEGKYIIFLDVDDFIPNNMFQLLYDSIEKEKTELVIGEYDVWNLKNEELVKSIRIRTNLNDLNGKEEISSGIIKANITPIFNYLWNKIYVRDIIIENNIQFKKELRYAEDLLFNVTYLKYVNKIKIIHESVYHYCKRNSTKSLSTKFREDIYENSIQIVEWWKNILEFYNVNEVDKLENLNKQYINRMGLLFQKLVLYVDNPKLDEILDKIYNNEKIINAYSKTSMIGFNNKIIKFCIVNKSRKLIKQYLHLKKLIYKYKGVKE